MEDKPEPTTEKLIARGLVIVTLVLGALWYVNRVDRNVKEDIERQRAQEQRLKEVREWGPSGLGKKFDSLRGSNR